MPLPARAPVWAIVSLSLLGASPSWAQDLAGVTPPAVQQAPTITELERRLELQRRELDEVLRQLRRLRGDDDAGDPDPRATPDLDAPRAADPIKLGLFFVESADGAHRIDVNGRLQVDGRFAAGRSDDAIDDSFLVRRARVEVSGKLYERVTFKLGLELGRTSNANLKDGYLDVQAFDWARLRVGQMLTPFSTERLTSSNVMKLPERPMIVGAVAESRELGLMLHGRAFDRLLTYAVGVFNGNGQNVGKDDDDGKDVVARLEVAPLAGLLLAGSYRFTPGDRASSRGPADVATVGNQLTRFLDYDTVGTRHLGARERGTLDARLRLGPVEVKGELLWDYFRDVRSAAGREADLLTWGWFVDASVVLTGEESQDTIEPARPLGVGAGAFELVLRYEELHADQQAIAGGFAVGSRDVRAETVGLTWIPVKRVRVLLSYTHSDFGTPVVDSSGHRRGDEHAIVARIGLWF